MAQQRLTKPNYVPLSHHHGHSYAILFFRPWIIEGKYPVGCWFSEQYYPTDGSSQASFLAGNLYMDLNNGTYLYRVLVCSLARWMFCFRLWILWENLPYSHSAFPGEMLSCLYIVADSSDGETPLAQPALWCLHCKAPWFQRRRACSACIG